MFNFLNPVVLYALGVALIPIIIHLLNRKKKKEIRFSTVHFLKQMVRREIRHLRLRQIILLIIRTLILLLIVLAFSRPTMRVSNSLLRGKSSTEAIIIIDNSLSLNSMQLNGTLLEEVKQWWLKLENVFQRGDRITVILGVHPIRILAERAMFNDVLWQKVAKEIQPSFLRGDLIESVIKAIEIAHRSDIYNKEIYLISDFQETGLNKASLNQLENELGDQIKFFFLPVFHGDDENASIDSVHIVNRLVEKNQILKVQAFIKNQNPTNNLNMLVSSVINSRRVSRKSIMLQPSRLHTELFKINLQESGFISGFIECENDALLEDNRYYFNFKIPEKIEMLHLIPAMNFNSFLPIILEPAIENRIIIYEKKSINEWVGIDFSKFNVIVMEGLNRIPIGLINRLEQLSRRDYGLIIIPGSNISPENFNILLTTFNLGKIQSKVGDESQTEEFVSLGTVNWNHPLFEGLFEEKNKLNPIVFYSYYHIKPINKSEVVMRLKNRLPFLIGSHLNAVNVFLISSPLQKNWTNLVFRGIVVPLLYRLSIYVSTINYQQRASIEVGKPYFQVFRSLRSPFEFTLKSPSGIENRLSPVFKGSEIQLKINGNLEPGNYEILQGDKLLTVYSVNHPPQESVQSYYSQSDLERILPESFWIAVSDNLIKQVRVTRFGIELWPYLIGTVLALLILEMIIARTATKKQKEEIKHEFV